MSNNQMFFSLVGVMIAGLGFLKYYMDARFDGMNAKFDARFDGMFDGLNAKFDGLKDSMNQRFTSVDNQLTFLIEHFVDHESRISKLEAE